MDRRWIRPVAFAGALVLVGAACGGDDDALTKEDWIRAANAICGEAGEAFNALFEEGFPTTEERAQTFVADVVPILEEEVNDLQNLEAPEDEADAETIDDALARGEAAVDDLREASESPGDSAAIFQAEGGENLVAFEDGLVEFGAQRCDLDDEEGDGEEGEVEAPDPSTFSAEKVAFIEEADAICQAANDVINPAEDELFGEEGSDFPTLEEWEEFLTLVIETNAPAQAQLEALEPPAEDAEQAEAIFERFASLLDDLTVARDAAADGDQEAFDEAIGNVFPQFEEIDRQARQYGFQVCGLEEDDGGGDDGEEDGGEPEEGGEE